VGTIKNSHVQIEPLSAHTLTLLPLMLCSTEKDGAGPHVG